MARFLTLLTAVALARRFPALARRRRAAGEAMLLVADASARRSRAAEGRDAKPRFAVALFATAVLLYACGGAPEPPADVVVTMKDFSVTANKSSIAAGKVTMLVRNTGSTAHDFWIVKSDAASGSLPQEGGRAQATALHKTGELNPGQRQPLELDLAPGKYILICNVVTHYGLGMHTSFEVK